MQQHFGMVPPELER
jgi:hypothetical protein